MRPAFPSRKQQKLSPDLYHFAGAGLSQYRLNVVSPILQSAAYRTFQRGEVIVRGCHALTRVVQYQIANVGADVTMLSKPSRHAAPKIMHSSITDAG
jgi:hypothetical protein